MCPKNARRTRSAVLRARVLYARGVKNNAHILERGEACSFHTVHLRHGMIRTVHLKRVHATMLNELCPSWTPWRPKIG